MPKSIRFLPFFLSISAAIFAIARLSEPNEHLWVVIYGTFSAVSGFVFFDKFHKLTLLTLLSGYLASLFYILPHLYKNLSFNPDQGYSINIYDLQNIFGLTISIIGIIHYLILAHKLKEAMKPQPLKEFQKVKK